eukprot:363798-Chlamydomonas_euryale.AAC.7
MTQVMRSVTQSLKAPDCDKCGPRNRHRLPRGVCLYKPAFVVVKFCCFPVSFTCGFHFCAWDAKQRAKEVCMDGSQQNVVGTNGILFHRRVEKTSGSSRDAEQRAPCVGHRRGGPWRVAPQPPRRRGNAESSSAVEVPGVRTDSEQPRHAPCLGL